MSTREQRNWAVHNGYPEQAGRHGRLPEQVIAAYRAAHPDEATTVLDDDEPAPEPLTDWDHALLAELQEKAAEDDDDPNYTVIVNAWDGDHATAIAQAAANLIGATHDSTKQRILAALREQGTCRCITDAITIIEAMA